MQLNLNLDLPSPQIDIWGTMTTLTNIAAIASIPESLIKTWKVLKHHVKITTIYGQILKVPKSDLLAPSKKNETPKLFKLSELSKYIHIILEAVKYAQWCTDCYNRANPEKPLDLKLDDWGELLEDDQKLKKQICAIQAFEKRYKTFYLSYRPEAHFTTLAYDWWGLVDGEIPESLQILFNSDLIEIDIAKRITASKLLQELKNFNGEFEFDASGIAIALSQNLCKLAAGIYSNLKKEWSNPVEYIRTMVERQGLSFLHPFPDKWQNYLQYPQYTAAIPLLAEVVNLNPKVFESLVAVKFFSFYAYRHNSSKFFDIVRLLPGELKELKVLLNFKNKLISPANWRSLLERLLGLEDGHLRTLNSTLDSYRRHYKQELSELSKKPPKAIQGALHGFFDKAFAKTINLSDLMAAIANVREVGGKIREQYIDKGWDEFDIDLSDEYTILDVVAHADYNALLVDSVSEAIRAVISRYDPRLLINGSTHDSGEDIIYHLTNEFYTPGDAYGREVWDILLFSGCIRDDVNKNQASIEDIYKFRINLLANDPPDNANDGYSILSGAGFLQSLAIGNLAIAKTFVNCVPKFTPSQYWNWKFKVSKGCNFKIEDWWVMGEIEAIRLSYPEEIQRLLNIYPTTPKGLVYDVLTKMKTSWYWDSSGFGQMLKGKVVSIPKQLHQFLTNTKGMYKGEMVDVYRNDLEAREMARILLEFFSTCRANCGNDFEHLFLSLFNLNDEDIRGIFGVLRMIVEHGVKCDVGADPFSNLINYVGNRFFQDFAKLVPLTVQSLKTKYRELSKQHHPDLGGNKEDFQELSDCYESFLYHLEG